jgi:beta-N-acetylhexosaminidase
VSSELERLATTCIFPGFEGAVVPDWVRRRLGEGLGGVVLYAWNVESREQLAALTEDLRAEREDVLIAIDEEGGDVTRLEAGTGSSYPGNAALGAVDDAALTEDVAAAMGADLAEVGVNVNLAPVADVNTNPLNPVIGIRAFGAEAELVARHVAAFVRGMQGARVAACAKHFPGHGDTSVDSHLALPVVESLEEQALIPFRAAVEADVRAIMTAHIVVRSSGDTPATMNAEIIRGVLREELGFRRLVISDALEMRAISATVGVEEGAVRTIAAGADALCLGHDLFDESVASVRDALVAAVLSGQLAETRLAEAADRVRATAEWSLADRSRRRVARSVGLDAARRAVRGFGDRSLTRPPLLVVELEPEPNMAVGRPAETPADWLGAIVPDAATVHFDEKTIDTELPLDGRELVIVARDLHRHEWERAAVGALLQRAPDALVVEVGLPHWRPPAAVRYVATYGAARVNLEAAAERLYSGPRRGVEQSGSSPGS